MVENTAVDGTPAFDYKESLRSKNRIQALAGIGEKNK